MNFSGYIDFDDFCKKEKMTPADALNFLGKELDKLETNK